MSILRIGWPVVLVAGLLVYAGCTKPTRKPQQAEKTESKTEGFEAKEAGSPNSEQDAAPHETRPEVVTTWSIEDLPSPNVPDDTAAKLVGESRFRLSFQHNPSEWTLADVEKTNAQLNRTDITLVLNGVPIGEGNQGLANLRHLLSMLPRGTTVPADHCLTCQANRWSERIQEVGKASAASNGVTVTCDGAF